MPGMGEMVVILLIVLLIFGAGKLPEIGDALGRSIKNFKRAAAGHDEIEVAKKPELDQKKAKGLKPADASDQRAEDGDDADGAEDAEVVAAKGKKAKPPGS